MPTKSFLIIDKSILKAFWSSNYEMFQLAHNLRAFIIWREFNKFVLILDEDWKEFKREVREKLMRAEYAEEEDKTDYEKEMFEQLKSFVVTQKFFDEKEEEKTAEENLIILTKALTELGEVRVISNEYNNPGFNEKIGKAKVHSLDEFMKIVKIKCSGFKGIFEK
jgi:tRNA G10  N-methylase Trm11